MLDIPDDDPTTDDEPTEDGNEAETSTLPEFEGVQPVGVVTKVTGAGQRIHRPMHLREKVTLVIEAEVSGVDHKVTDDGIKRHHTLKALDLFELPGRQGFRLVNHLKESYRLGNPEGELPFEQIGDEALVDNVLGQTDAAGVVLTPGDLDDLGLNDGTNDPLTLTLDDGTVAVWPTDWTGKPPQTPVAGDTVWPPAGAPGDPEVLVVEVVDTTSGEQIGVWTAEDEEARLLEQEQAAMAAEAAAEQVPL